MAKGEDFRAARGGGPPTAATTLLGGADITRAVVADPRLSDPPARVGAWARFGRSSLVATAANSSPGGRDAVPAAVAGERSKSAPRPSWPLVASRSRCSCTTATRTSACVPDSPASTECSAAASSPARSCCSQASPASASMRYLLFDGEAICGPDGGLTREDRQVSEMRAFDAVGVDVRRQGAPPRASRGNAVRRSQRGGITGKGDRSEGVQETPMRLMEDLGALVPRGRCTVLRVVCAVQRPDSPSGRNTTSRDRCTGVA